MPARVHPFAGPAAPWGVTYTGKARRVFGWHDDTFLIWTDLLPLTVFIGLGGACVAVTEGFYQVATAFSNATPTRLCSPTMAPLQLSQKLPQRASDAPLEYAFSPLC